MRVLFKNTNLIGDGLNAIPVMEAWYLEHKSESLEIDLHVIDDQSKVLYQHINVPARIITSEAEYRFDYTMKFTFDVGIAFSIAEQDKCHIVDAYAKMLRAVDSLTTYGYKVNVPITGTPKKHDLVLVSPFSRSCSSHSGKPPNKMIPMVNWIPVLKHLSTFGEVAILGSAKDYALLPVSEDQFLTGLPLDEVALLLQHCKVLITIDNGISHLGASQGAPMLLFYPACLAQTWIAPRGHDNMCLIQIDPAATSPAYLKWSIKEIVPKLIEYKERKHV